MQNEIRLPSLAAYKPQCVDAAHSWLVYQTSLTQLRLIEYTIDFVIKQNLAINIGNEPLKAVKLIYSQQEKTVYVGIALLTKYLILKKNQVLHEHFLFLQCNIADFSSGFAAVEGVNDGLQIYFVFVTATGQIMTVPVHDVQKGVSFNVASNQRIASLATRNTFAYLGTEQGTLLRVDMNYKKIVGKYQTNSEFPIMTAKTIGNHIIIGTCDGELHILDQQLQQSKVVSAHDAMITILFIDNERIMSVGDDLAVRLWQFNSKQGTLQYLRQEQFKRRVNVLFSMHNRTLVGFYEQTLLQQL